MSSNDPLYDEVSVIYIYHQVINDLTQQLYIKSFQDAKDPKIGEFPKEYASFTTREKLGFRLSLKMAQNHQLLFGLSQVEKDSRKKKYLKQCAKEFLALMGHIFEMPDQAFQYFLENQNLGDDSDVYIDIQNAMNSLDN